MKSEGSECHIYDMNVSPTGDSTHVQTIISLVPDTG
jgi:hypothetical protein